MQFVDADDGLGESRGELTTGDKVFGFLHHHAHLLQMIRCKTIETAAVDNENGTFHADARHTEDALVIILVDVDGESLWVTKGPAKLGVNIKVEVSVGIIDNLIDIEMIEAHEPVGLVETILTHQGRLLQHRQAGVVGVHADVARVIDTPHRGLLVHSVRHQENIAVAFLRGSHNHLR